MLDEVRSHDAVLTDADANVLVDIGDRNVARAFPAFTGPQRADVVRCIAGYVEQTIAKNRGTVPPDGQDHE